MKLLKFYNHNGMRDEDEVFDYFIKNLKLTNRTFDFFVDWAKVNHNVSNIEVELNILNYLIGKENIEEEFGFLIKKYPSIVSVIPILIAVRENSLEVLIDYKDKDWKYKNYNFTKKKDYTDSEIEDIVEFCENIGLLSIFRNKKIKNLVDYIIGLEVGINTNGRKNRSGKIMESITEWYIKKASENLKFQYISQATKPKIKEMWDLNLPVDKSSRQYDFAIYFNNKLILLETNFFSGGGSKLKSVAGEFSALNNFLANKEEVDKFIWITDGIGWNTAHKPLKETFHNNDYVINTRMLWEGVLEEIIQV